MRFSRLLDEPGQQAESYEVTEPLIRKPNKLSRIAALHTTLTADRLRSQSPTKAAGDQDRPPLNGVPQTAPSVRSTLAVI